ncbi:MAG: hypothetical protein AAGD34_14480 [Pseudomonadota bacterium]
MAHCFLHVGFPKTGTTALQQAVFGARDAGRDNGLHVPDGIHNRHRWLQVVEARPKNANLARVLGVSDCEEQQRRAHAFIAEAGRVDASIDRVFLTEETLALADTRDLTTLYRLVADRFDGVTVLICFRRHMEYVRSTYNQRVKATNYTRPFEDYLDKFGSDLLGYSECLERFHTVFGKANVRCLTYDPDPWRGSNATILRLIGLPHVAGEEERGRNPSVSTLALETKRLFNTALCRSQTLHGGKDNPPDHKNMMKLIAALEASGALGGTTAPDPPPNPDLATTRHQAEWDRDWAYIESEAALQVA